MSPEHERARGRRCVSLCCGVETTGNLGQHISAQRTLTLQSAHFHHKGLHLRDILRSKVSNILWLRFIIQ